MRLKALVKRHGLPDTPIVWAVDGDLTISQILEQINEVIPLESGGDWGLEDYAFELQGSSGSGFECLHFQLAKQILKDEDEVVIRPLLTQDVRQRKFSGRHQLSADGRHLIDGFPFGRPGLKGPLNRPSIELPPRKKRRILQEEEDSQSEDGDFMALMDVSGDDSQDEDFGANDKQLVLHADFEDADAGDLEGNTSGDTSDEGSDAEEYVPTEADRSAMAAELEELAEDEDVKQEAVVALLRTSFPDAPQAICRNILQQANGDVGAAWDVLSRGFAPAKSRNMTQKASTQKSASSPAMTSAEVNGLSELLSDQADEHHTDANAYEEEGEEDDPKLRHYDQNGFEAGAIRSGKSLTEKPKIVFSDDVDDAVHGHSMADESGMDVADEDDESEDGDFEGGSTSSTSGSDSDSDDSSSDESDSTHRKPISKESQHEGQGLRVLRTTSECALLDDMESDSDSDTSNSDSSSSSGSESAVESAESTSDDEPEEASSKAAQTPVSETADTSTSTVRRHTAPTMVVPGSGSKSTQARNKRRRNANSLARFKAKGILPAGTTLSEFAALDMSLINTAEKAQEALLSIRSDTQTRRSSNERSKADLDFERRRQQLLDSLADGGIDVSADPLNDDRVAASNALPASDHMLNAREDVSASNDKAIVQTEEIEVQTPVSMSDGNSSGRKSRSKLDIGAGRRLLFGALGIKNPRSKADEEKVKQDLMKLARNFTPVRDASNVTTAPEIEHENSEAWREKITLKAVECCYEGVEYTEPPFPFIQRWDPQQQSGYGKRGGKGKRKQRDQSQYYEGRDQQKRQKNLRQDAGVTPNNYYDDFYDDDVEPSYDESYTATAKPYSPQDASDADAAVQDQLMHDSQVASTDGFEDDLPLLPTDMETLPAFSVDDAKPGAVIAFKQLEVSEATRWQPQISSYRTAVIIQLPENDMCSMQLAKRDRAYDDKSYDQETGERVYGKFEAPDDEDEADEEDDGIRLLPLSELVEPKLIQVAPESSTPQATTDESTTLDHENHAASHDDVDPSPDNGAQDTGMQDLEHSTDVTSAAAAAEDVHIHISDTDRQEISQFIKDAGFRSDIPSSVVKLHTLQQTSVAAHYSPRFNGLSSPVRVSHDSAADDVESEGSSVHYPSLPPLSSQLQNSPSQSHSHVTDCGRQPTSLQHYDEDDEVDGYCGKQSISLLVDEEDVDDTILANGAISTPSQKDMSQEEDDLYIAHQHTEKLSQSSGVSGSDLPSLEDVFSTARSGRSSVRPTSCSETNSRLMLSEIDQRAQDSYEKAMEKLDAQLDGTDDGRDGAVDDVIVESVSQSQQSVKPSSKSTNCSSLLAPPPGSQIVFLLSSDEEPAAVTSIEARKRSIFKSKAASQPAMSGLDIASSKCQDPADDSIASNAEKYVSDDPIDEDFMPSGSSRLKKGRSSGGRLSMSQGSRPVRRTSGRRKS